MTNTKFRKRALLSSVAMMLVALVALGSATFAWFQADTTVHASGMNFSTNATAGLKIASDTQKDDNGVAALDAGDYVSGTLTLDPSLTATALKPASLNQDTGVFYYTTGTDAADGTKGTDAAVTTCTNYISETLYFMQDPNGEAATDSRVYLTGVSIDAGDADTLVSDMSDSIRVAVFQADGTTLIGEFSIAGGTGESFFYVDTTDGNKIKIDATGKTVTQAATGLKLDTGINATQIAAAANAVVVRVYFDGFDQHVTTNNAITIHSAQDILDAITLDFDMDADPASP